MQSQFLRRPQVAGTASSIHLNMSLCLYVKMSHAVVSIYHIQTKCGCTLNCTVYLYSVVRDCHSNTFGLVMRYQMFSFPHPMPDCSPSLWELDYLCCRPCFPRCSASSHLICFFMLQLNN